MIEDKLVALLLSIGLSKNEIDVYLDLLKNRASTAYSIAQRINLHRSSVYEALRKLQKIGFIVEIIEENRKLYQTKDYKAIKEYLNQKQSDLEEIIHYIKEVSNTDIPNGSISVSYGLTRLRSVLSGIFNLKHDLLLWVIPKNIEKTLGDWFLNEINEKIKKNEFTVKIITSEETQTFQELSKNPKTEIKIFNEDTNIFTIVCFDIVYLIVIGNPITIIEMKSADISEGFRTRFLTYWERSKNI